MLHNESSGAGNYPGHPIVWLRRSAILYTGNCVNSESRIFIGQKETNFDGKLSTIFYVTQQKYRTETGWWLSSL